MFLPTVLLFRLLLWTHRAVMQFQSQRFRVLLLCLLQPLRIPLLSPLLLPPLLPRLHLSPLLLKVLLSRRQVLQLSLLLTLPRTQQLASQLTRINRQAPTALRPGRFRLLHLQALCQAPPC